MRAKENTSTCRTRRSFRLRARQSADSGGKDGRADGVGFRAEEEFDRGTADAALAWAHAAARLQFRFAPSGIASDAPERHVFAAADDRVVRSEGFQFGAKCEGPFERRGEPAVALE